MRNPIVRGALAIVGGILVAGIVVAIMETIGHSLFPPPEGLDPTNPADQARFIELIPLEAKLAVMLAWFLGALAGAWVALKIGGKSIFAWIIAAVMAALSLWTTQMFPHPAWMVAGAIALPALAALLARRLVPPSP